MSTIEESVIDRGRLLTNDPCSRKHSGKMPPSHTLSARDKPIKQQISSISLTVRSHKLVAAEKSLAQEDNLAV